MNPTNRKRHLQSCPSCREKGEREQRITTFFHKKVSQDGDVRSAASSSGANVEEDDMQFTVETLEQISVEAEVVVHTDAGIIDIPADIVAESGSKEVNVDAEEEICADADIDSGHHETVNLNLKCEGYRLMVLNPAYIHISCFHLLCLQMKTLFLKMDAFIISSVWKEITCYVIPVMGMHTAINSVMT